MKTIKTILLAVICLTTANLFSQVNNSITEAPYIEVTGTAEMKIVPDEIYISITLHERIENKIKIPKNTAGGDGVGFGVLGPTNKQTNKPG